MSTPVVGVFLGLFFISWITAVKSLGKQFDELSQSPEEPTPTPTETAEPTETDESLVRA
jgi:hypothetical protein